MSWYVAGVMNSHSTSLKDQRSKFRYPLLVSGVWNIVFGGIGLFLPETSKAVFSETEIIANPYWWSIVLFAGIGYAIVGYAISRFRFFITLGIIGKLAFFGLISYLWVNQTATDFALIIAIGDLLWAVYFIYFLNRTREYGYL